MTALRRVLGIFAHPDDETVLVGGTLALLHERGVQTHVMCATRGEGGESGDPPVVTDRRYLGEAREAELRRAADALGITTLTLLDYVDPTIGPEDTMYAFTHDEATLVARLAHLIDNSRPDVVLSHGPDGEYGHPGHQLLYRATRQAVLQHAPDVLHYSICATVPGIEDRIWNASRDAHLVLDITPWAEQKVAAMEAHVTQHALFKRRRKLQTVREALRSVESFYREHPATNGLRPDDQFAALLQEAGAQAFPGEA